jgi:hypothetical protein
MSASSAHKGLRDQPNCDLCGPVAIQTAGNLYTFNALLESASSCYGCSMYSSSIMRTASLLKTRERDLVYFRYPTVHEKRGLVEVLDASHDTQFAVLYKFSINESNTSPFCFTPDSFRRSFGTWIDQCSKTHGLCQPIIKGRLPKRVIDVGHREAHLYETAGEFGDYVALSHAWSYSQPLKTTISTLKQRLGRLVWQELPTAFQEAILVVRAVGLRYLWIDSLCIIQDDHVDWEVEAARMASIYENAYLTIMLHQSKDGDSSFPRPLEESNTKQINFRPILTKGFVSDFRNSPADVISFRGWCFQVMNY